MFKAFDQAQQISMVQMTVQSIAKSIEIAAKAYAASKEPPTATWDDVE